MRRFLAPSGNDESAKHAPSRSRLLCGRRKNDSVNPCVGEGVRNYGSTVFWLAAWGFGTLGGVRCSFSGVWIFGLRCLGVRNFGSTVFWLAAWGFGTLGGGRSLGVWIFGLLCLGVRNFGSTVFWLAGYLGSGHLDLRLSVWLFAAGRMVLRFFLGSHGTLVAVSAPFMMSLRDSEHSNEYSLYVL